MSRPMKDSGVDWIGEVPEHWDVVPVKRKYKNTKEIVGDREPDFQRLALTLNGVIRRPKESAEGLQPEKFNTYQIVYNQELLFKLIDLENVRTSRVGYSPFTGIVSPVYIRLINPQESKYGYYYFTNLWHQEVFNFLGSGVRSSLSASTLLNMPYLSVPKTEQYKIVGYLDNKTAQIDSIIADTRLSIVEFKKYKQAVITETVTKGLNPDVKMKNSGIEWIGEIPESWNVSRLRYLGTLQNGISKSGDAFGSGFPFLSYGDVYRDIELPKTVSGLIESSESDRLNYSVKYGDVLFTRTSETIEEVGFSSTCLETIPDVVFAGFVIRFRPITDDLYPRFSKYYFRSQIHRSFFAKEMNLVIRASLSQQLLKKLPVLLPSIEEQQQIADYLDEKCAHIDSLIADKEKLIGEFETYKKALIFEYVTGKKEVE